MTRVDGTWRTRAATQAVTNAISQAGHEILFVGGCVRNALMGEPVGDIDLATDARPQAVMHLSDAAGLKPVPTGIDHGTITVVSDGIPHEITTFRKDVETDGRRAVVAYADTVLEDARRRDFTMNALYARPDGTLVDPLGGLGDLQNRHVRFIGSAQDRIREDYLRSLRFFRFFAWYGRPDDGPDAEALAAIAETQDGLDRLSAERVGVETLKLLSAPDPARAVAAMRATGVLARILPGASDTSLAPLVHIEADAGLDPDPIRRLAVLGLDMSTERLRLSRSHAKALADLRAAVTSGMRPSELGYRYGKAVALDALAILQASTATPWSDEAGIAARHGSVQTCPVTAADLMPGLRGAALGARLRALEAAWIASDFTLARDDLLSLD